MENLNIPGTDFTPEIDFNIDSMIFRLAGVSRPEDVRGFYEQIIEWLSDFEPFLRGNKGSKKSLRDLRLEFRLAYFNSASSKYLLEILKHLKKLRSSFSNLVIMWYYDRDDDQLKEDIEDLSEACDLDFIYYELS